MKTILSGLEVKGELRVSKHPENEYDVVTKQYLEETTQHYEGELQVHLNDRDNPHEVTAEQLDLGSFVGFTPETMPITPKMQAELDKKANLTDISTIYRPMGSVPTYADLPKPPNVHVGDVYDVRETGMNYVWVVRDGVAQWDELGLGIDIRNYYTIDEVNEIEKGLSIRIDDETTARTDADAALGKRIDDEITAREDADAELQDAISAEAQARQDADTALGKRIDDEATARETADTALGKRIDDEVQARKDADSALQNALDSEVQARKDADSALQNALDTEAQAREDADTALGKRIDDEVQARTDADSTLQNALDTEVQARTDADTAMGKRIDDEIQAREEESSALQDALDDEIQARKDADTTLQNNIDTEAQTRATNDATLQNNIDAEAQTRATDDSTLQANITAEATAREEADTILQENIDGKVSKSGDTMTGELTLQRFSPILFAKDTNPASDITVAPTVADTMPFCIQVYDKNRMAYGDVLYVKQRRDTNVFVFGFGNCARRWSGGIQLINLPDGTEYATAPKTLDDAISNEIATANWVNTKLTAYPRVVRTTITGDGNVTTFSVPHGLGVSTAIVQVYRAGEQVFTAITMDSTSVTLSFSTAPGAGEVLDIVMVG